MRARVPVTLLSTSRHTSFSTSLGYKDLSVVRGHWLTATEACVFAYEYSVVTMGVPEYLLVSENSSPCGGDED